MSARTVFWPQNVRTTGFCYGWTAPTLCVAAVSTDAWEDWGDDARWVSCGGPPVYLGQCVFDPGNVHPNLEFPDLNEYTIIYYQRHPTSSLRFHVLEPPTPRTNLQARSLAFAKLRAHDFTRPLPTESQGIDSLVVKQFNAAHAVHDIIGAAGLHKLTFQYFFAVVVTILSVPKRWLPTPNSTLAGLMGVLSELSSTVQQLDARTRHLVFLSQTAYSLRDQDLVDVPAYARRYITFFNTVWLILNDVTIGVAFGSFLSENSAAIAGLVDDFVQTQLIGYLLSTLQWLDSWPAGLKLNTELSASYARAFSGLITVWATCLRHLAPGLQITLGVLGLLTSWFGLSTGLAAAADLLAVVTMHITLCYFVTRFLYAWMLTTAGSLWRLFRGKRYNVLRNRNDTWEYDTDQLLLGTILFTLLTFLFPTVLVYYALFAVLRFGTLLLTALLETQIALMNTFPLFALMLRVKDPWRLPGGIYFHVGSTLTIKNQPVPLSTIFVQYVRLCARLAAHYNPLRLLWCVFRGELLAAIPRTEMLVD